MAYKPAVDNKARMLNDADPIVTRKRDQFGQLYFFESVEARDAYKEHVGLSGYGTDPLTGRAWGRP